EEVEEKPTKPVARKRAKAASSGEVEEAPAEVVAEAATEEVEEKPTKPVARKRAKASTESKESDATT
ncbi:hypothetical protein ACFLTY_05815, partial [Chloroflexota bacterium]